MPSEAYIELLADAKITDHPTALRVYGLLLRDPLIQAAPRVVKIAAMALALGLRCASVSEAINLLVERGYLVDCGRNARGMRRLLVPHTLDRTPKAA